MLQHLCTDIHLHISLGCYPPPSIAVLICHTLFIVLKSGLSHSSTSITSIRSLTNLVATIPNLELPATSKLLLVIVFFLLDYLKMMIHKRMQKFDWTTENLSHNIKSIQMLPLSASLQYGVSFAKCFFCTILVSFCNNQSVLFYSRNQILTCFKWK